MLGADTAYPLHAHDAEELYFPLAGHADWARGKEAYSVKPSGDDGLSSLAGTTRHANQCGTLLSSYIWRDGDLTHKSDIIAN